jgi:hypothetical protein
MEAPTPEKIRATHSKTIRALTIDSLDYENYGSTLTTHEKPRKAKLVPSGQT